MRKLITALVATLTILLAGSIVGKAEAAPRPMFPLTQSYTPTEEVAYYHRYARRHYRRGKGDPEGERMALAGTLFSYRLDVAN